MEFSGFPKIARLSRNCVITEKIDGTNASIYIGENGEFMCGSRTRWITPDNDNAGFARWAYARREELTHYLGKGQHFGEWWGSGIQRGYGLPKGEKRFSLFNVSRWCLHGTEPKIIIAANPKIKDSVDVYQKELPSCCGLVPVLYNGIFTTQAAEEAIDLLKQNGSIAAPGFMQPEGIIIYHAAANTMFKKTIEHDEVPKNSVEIK